MSVAAPPAPAETQPQGSPPNGIKARPATGKPSWPLVLLEGDEKAGKSLAAAVFSADPRIGQIYWIDLGEGSGDEYGAVEGSKLSIVEHNGTYRDIFEQTLAIRAEAERARLAGEPPVGIVLDTGSSLWAMLTGWTNERARRSKRGQAILAEDPDAEIDPGRNLWNDANDRWFQILRVLQTFPGPAIIIARGKEITQTDPNGQPYRDGRTEHKVEGQKGLAYDASVVVRMTREPRRSLLVGARTLRVAVDSGDSFVPPMKDLGPWKVLDIGELLFGVIGVEPGVTQARPMVQLRGDQISEALEEVEYAKTEGDLHRVWEHWKQVLDGPERQKVVEAVTTRLHQVRAQATSVEPDRQMAAEHDPRADGSMGEGDDE